MADLSGVDEKIKRANEHVEEVQRRIDAFVGLKPYEAVVEPDPQRSERCQVVLKIHRPISADILLSTGDAVHNLRSALDHLACAAVEAGGGSVTTDTAFPIWRKPSAPTPQDYRSLVLGKVKGAPQPLIDLVLALQPYEGGHHEALWAIDYLDITDKHRLLIQALASHRELRIKPLADWDLPAVAEIRDTFTIGLVPEDRFPLKDGDVLFNTTWDDVQSQDPQSVISIALGEPSILMGEPLVPALTQLVEFATGVIDNPRAVL